MAEPLSEEGIDELLSDEGDDADGVFTSTDDGERVDAALTRHLEASRTAVASWIRAGRVVCDGRVVRRPSQRVRADERWRVSVPVPTPDDALPQDLPLEIVHEDEDVVVVHKASGMVVHPAPGHPDGTLVNALLFHCRHLSGIGGRIRPGIVHRIDRDTSGLLVATKNDRAHQVLAEQFAAHSIQRVYEAIAVRVSGAGLEDALTIDTPHRRHPNDRKRFTGQHGGERRAVTHVEVLDRWADGALRVRCRLSTGRTHQIRMHLSERGCPLLSDPIYGGRAVNANRLIPRLALHAAVLGFVHPDGRSLYFEAPLPHDMRTAMERLERGESWRA